MPDDCGHIEIYFANALKNMQLNSFNEAADPWMTFLSKINYKKTCPYCRTDPKKEICVNCGAPQEV